MKSGHLRSVRMQPKKRLSEKEKTLRLTGWTEKEYNTFYTKTKRTVAKGKQAGIYTPNLSPAKALRLSVQYPDTPGGIRESLENVASAKDPVAYDAERRIEKTKELEIVLPRLHDLVQMYRDGTLTAIEFIEAHKAFMDSYDFWKRTTKPNPLEFYNYMS